MDVCGNTLPSERRLELGSGLHTAEACMAASFIRLTKPDNVARMGGKTYNGNCKAVRRAGLGSDLVM